MFVNHARFSWRHKTSHQLQQYSILSSVVLNPGSSFYYHPFHLPYLSSRVQLYKRCSSSLQDFEFAIYESRKKRAKVLFYSIIFRVASSCRNCSFDLKTWKLLETNITLNPKMPNFDPNVDQTRCSRTEVNSKGLARLIFLFKLFQWCLTISLRLKRKNRWRDSWINLILFSNYYIYFRKNNFRAVLLYFKLCNLA